ncbi:hypothetical protein ACP70R_033834 [Stipagrostis hirtigluma subsp. patula]
MARGPSSPAELPPEVIQEIILRLPPRPSCFRRVSLVCKLWRRLARDPGFIRRFRLRHLHAPPLLGFFGSFPRFVPAYEPPERFTLPSIGAVDNIRVLGCRHGRVLLHGRYRYGSLQLVVWDPTRNHDYVFPGPQNPLHPGACVPPPFHGSLICVHDHDGHGEECPSRPFRIVILFYGSGCIYASAIVYPQHAWWRDLVSLAAPHDLFSSIQPGVLVGNAMYWLSSRQSKIVVLHLDTNRLRLIESLPMDSQGSYDYYQIIKAGDGGLGVAAIRGSHLHLFSLTTISDGTAMWSEYRTVGLDTLLSPLVKAIEVSDEDASTIFLATINGIFELRLESMEVNKVLQRGEVIPKIAYRSFYARGGSGRDDGENEVAAQQQV